MSELTAYNSERIYWAVEQVEQEAGDLDTLHLDDNLFYLKSEADKVIADKDAKILQYKVLYKELCRDINNQERHFAKQLYHQKYKRCLAMARWCASRSLAWMADPADDILHKSDFYDKWKLRWRKLAEKFKPNNSTAQ